MVLKFAANLNFLFAEATTIAERIHLAHKAGFRAVEIPFPRNQEEQVVKAKNDTGIKIALMNVALGTDNLSLGSSSIPGAENHFRTHLNETIILAKKLQCNKIHLMAGLVKELPLDQHLKTYEANLKYAAGILQKENMMGVIEPINKYSVPSYFMNSYELARTILDSVNSQHLRLMLDIFHLQLIRGNITHAFQDLSHLIGHIQIAQAPNRHEPDHSGELNYEYVFSLIEALNYNDWIGCEYKPRTNTTEGLQWLTKYGLEL